MCRRKIDIGIKTVFGGLYAEREWIIDCSKSKKWASASSKDFLIKDIVRVCESATDKLMGMYLVDAITWREYIQYKARITNRMDEMLAIIK